MRQRLSPRLDGRSADVLAAALMARLPGYAPGCAPAPGGPGWALVQVYARYLGTLIERVDQAPDRTKLAFLNSMGLDVLPSQAARAPVVFVPVARAGDSRVPARTRLGAKAAGRSEPLVFETEADIALASARLTDVVTLWPGRDAYADHGVAAAGQRPWTLFDGLQPVPHALYLGHGTCLALAGRATVEIRFELTALGSVPLALVWEYWDGTQWQGFLSFKPAAAAGPGDSVDGTEGLTRSGIVRLVADAATSVARRLQGVLSHWVRARNAAALPQGPSRLWPRIARLGVRSVLSNPLGRLGLAERSDSPTAPAGRSSLFLQVVGVDAPGLVEVAGESVRFEQPLALTASAAAGVAVAGWTDLPPGSYQLRIEQPGYALLDAAVALDPQRHAQLIFAPLPGDFGVQAEAIYGDAQKLDSSKAFLPFGPIAQAGACFYLRSTEAFARPGAEITLAARAVAGSTGSVDAVRAGLSLVAEAWTGDAWESTGAPASPLLTLFTSGSSGVAMVLPTRLAPTTVNGEAGHWLRIRIATGAFANVRTVKIDGADAFTFVEHVPQALERLRIGYEYRSALEAPDACLTHNDFDWQDHTADARRQGQAFEPFRPVQDNTPALYLGFDAPLPADLLSLYFDIEERSGEVSGPALRWEYWDGGAWGALEVDDETRHLALPGMVSLLWPGVSRAAPVAVTQAQGQRVQLADSHDAPLFQSGDVLFIGRDGAGELVRVAGIEDGALLLAAPLEKDHASAFVERPGLSRFGTPRTWMRARLQQDGEPRAARLDGIRVNAVWASQVQTFDNEVLGSGNGEPDQAFFVRQIPVLPGQVLEVRELDGARAAIELPMLLEELRAHGMSEADVRTVYDRRSGQISQVWVRWQERPHLFFSAAGDRHYVVERTRGRVAFGPARPLPPAPDNVMMRSYRAGGGREGNVPAGAVSQLLGGVLAQSVSNVRAAEGGADAESGSSALQRSPIALRHRWQALSAEDYEALAREASPAVAVARALPATHPSGRSLPGWVRLIVMPHSEDERPWPSLALRERIREFLERRAPAELAGRIDVGGPDYVAVGVAAVLGPQQARAGADTLAAAAAALRRFLHPLTGGPCGDGWPFGRDVYLSDLAALLESVAGIDHVRTLELTLNGTPHGEVVAVPPDRIVVAGPLQLSLAGS